MPPSPCSGGWSRAGWSTLSNALGIPSSLPPGSLGGIPGSGLGKDCLCKASSLRKASALLRLCKASSLLARSVPGQKLPWARLGGLMPVAQTEHARALGWGLHGEGLGTGTCAPCPGSRRPPHPFGEPCPEPRKDSALPDLAHLFFHLPPRSFCQEHRPAQTVQAHQDGQTSCLICLEHVEEKLSYQTMVCPNCRQAWFHRGCIQVRGPSCAP